MLRAAALMQQRAPDVANGNSEIAAPAPAGLRVLSIIPPMTQLNTPYPSTAYLTGFLRSRGVDAVQVDLALDLVLVLLTPQGLAQVHLAHSRQRVALMAIH